MNKENYMFLAMQILQFVQGVHLSKSIQSFIHKIKLTKNRKIHVHSVYINIMIHNNKPSHSSKNSTQIYIPIMIIIKIYGTHRTYISDPKLFLNFYIQIVCFKSQYEDRKLWYNFIRFENLIEGEHKEIIILHCKHDMTQ